MFGTDAVAFQSRANCHHQRIRRWRQKRRLTARKCLCNVFWRYAGQRRAVLFALAAIVITSTYARIANNGFGCIRGVSGSMPPIGQTAPARSHSRSNGNQLRICQSWIAERGLSNSHAAEGGFAPNLRGSESTFA